MIYILPTASYFVTSYHNASPCSVVVGESTEVFPASKPTTLESNKSLTRPHQTPTSGSGKRARRSVDEHASEPPSLSSLDSSAVDMHELITTPSVNTFSVVHGVSEGETTEDQGDAYVSSVRVDNIGELTNAELKTTTLYNPTVEVNSEAMVYTSTGVVSDNTNKPDSHVDLPPETVNEIPKIGGIIDSIAIVPKTMENIQNTNKPDSLDDFTPKFINKLPKTGNKDNFIAYDPAAMQSDSFSSILWRGLQKVHYMKLESQLKEVNDELHININDSEDINNDLEKFHYDSESNNAGIKNTRTISTTTTIPVTTTEQIISTKTKPIVISTSSNIITSPEKHGVITTEPALSVTNFNNPVINNTTDTVDQKASTVNIAAESKTPETSNPKHVMINLTISADAEDNSAYKPLYSLTVKVPTVGDSSEMPSVKITPIDVTPTAPSFNNPTTVEGKTVNKTVMAVPIFEGGTCECSCPVCEGENPRDDFYDDYYDKSTTGASKIESSTTSDVTTNDDVTLSTTDPSTQYDKTTETTEDQTFETSTVESTTLTDVTDSTTELTTETATECPSTTEVPKCVCPKVTPPPILILEGEVTLLVLNHVNLLTDIQPSG